MSRPPADRFSVCCSLPDSGSFCSQDEAPVLPSPHSTATGLPDPCPRLCDLPDPCPRHQDLPFRCGTSDQNCTMKRFQNTPSLESRSSSLDTVIYSMSRSSGATRDSGQQPSPPGSNSPPPTAGEPHRPSAPSQTPHSAQRLFSPQFSPQFSPLICRNISPLAARELLRFTFPSPVSSSVSLEKFAAEDPLYAAKTLHTDQDYDRTLHTDQDYDRTLHTDQDYDRTLHTDQDYDRTLHTDQDYDRTLHTDQDYDRTLHTDQDYDRTLHTDQDYDRTLHTDQDYDRTLHTDQDYDRTLHTDQDLQEFCDSLERLQKQDSLLQQSVQTPRLVSSSSDSCLGVCRRCGERYPTFRNRKCRDQGTMTSNMALAVDVGVQTSSRLGSCCNLDCSNVDSQSVLGSPSVLGSHSFLGSPPGSRLNLRCTVGSHSNLVSPSSSMFAIHSDEDEGDAVQQDVSWETETETETEQRRSCLKPQDESRQLGQRRSSMKQVQWDEDGMTWDVHGAALDPEELNMAIQKHLELRCSEEPQEEQEEKHKQKKKSPKKKRAPRPPQKPPLILIEGKSKEETRRSGGEEGHVEEAQEEEVRRGSQSPGVIQKRKLSFKTPGWCGGTKNQD